MINHELGHFIATFYLFAYFLVFILSFMNRNNNKSNLIVVALALSLCIFNQYLKISLGFYFYYLGAAACTLFCILFSLAAHLFLKVKHEISTLFIYGFYFLISISYLVIHRVRVVIFDTDEPIMWLINSQSAFSLTLYLLSICVFVYGTKIKWKWHFGRLSL
ncbi:hypothetical protein [Colwellia psychrerythraea]|uniref:Uncharacterized protein n=1 Tax=Colwellia psychrerythraea TaxID=28229 RepID=A0A099K7U2_COLPS|nr:hypothetical protein [Colwellia psychrerythraea]KGJ86854.1 hypothetical protein GAB14E_4681 [Colwellia psychrerythraea]